MHLSHLRFDVWLQNGMQGQSYHHSIQIKKLKSFLISLAYHYFNLKWCRLFTSKMEEIPANCLETAINYYAGSSMFIIETVSGAIFNGCGLESKWKVCYFLFQLEPSASKICSSSRIFNHIEKHVTEGGKMSGLGFNEGDDDTTKWSSSHLLLSLPLDFCVTRSLGDWQTKVMMKPR